MEDIKYVVVWLDFDTVRKSALSDKRTAQAWCAYANIQNPTIKHWIEPVKVNQGEEK